MRKIKIIDLDGCLADDRWRRPLILAQPTIPIGRSDPSWASRFHAYHTPSHLDVPVNQKEVRVPGLEYVILTGRPVMYAEQTRHWVHRALNIAPLFIVHRNNDDHRPSHLLKGDQVEWLLTPQLNYGIQREELVEAIDDVEAIVKMYQERWDIPARLVRVGEEEHENG